MYIFTSKQPLVELHDCTCAHVYMFCGMYKQSVHVKATAAMYQTAQPVLRTCITEYMYNIYMYM